MNHRAYDKNLVVHLTHVKGGVIPVCEPLPSSQEDGDAELNTVSPMALPRDTPVTCMRCLGRTAASMW